MLILFSITIIILLFVLLAVLTFARDLLATFLNAIVRFFRRLVGRDQKQDNEGQQTVRKRTRAKKKVLSDSDGEYVDFEEVKK
ncbi:MAG: hypothetical protein IKN61_08225 [Bacteroidaceae bacterium]|jgi:hypothetical protein|nr:hypothetical protein [Bacteroidaceae bacterium]MBR3659874.1 hypothetical protein [Bacteroidaceae bacterium]MBR6856460.1 hypothetical protein [Bacteroidaceae bacterium]